MFDVFLDILRPEDGERRKLDAVYEEWLVTAAQLDKILDAKKDNAVFPGKEAEFEAVIAKRTELKRRCRGKAHSIPDVGCMTMEFFNTLDMTFFARFGQIANSIGIPDMKKLWQARERYATDVRDQFLKLSPIVTNVDDPARRVWVVRAFRAEILLSPNGPSEGIWPLPTAESIKRTHTMLESHEDAILEVRFQFVQFADGCMCYHRRKVIRTGRT